MTALPPALDGHEYRSRNIGGDAYQTTGLFRRGAPQGTLEHLVSAPSLVLDCDLVDYERKQGTKDERKAELHALPSADLEARIGALACHVSGIVAQICGAPPTRVVSSGYGVHVYLWLTPADALRVADVRRANKALLVSVNEVAGFAIADPAVHDAGTRILRIPGTMNNKNKAVPRPVVVLQSHDTTHDLERWLTAAPQRPAPSAPSASMPPAPSAPYVVTSDPFAAAFGREADALAWVLAHCPFFVWAQAHPQEVGRSAWRGAAVNIAALAGEGGRAAFHTFSALDPSRYDRSSCDELYADALRSAESHGPITYAVLAEGGDWPGPAPDGARSPAASGRQGVKPAASVAALADPGDELWRNAKTGAIRVTVGNLRKILRADLQYGQRLRFNRMRGQAELDGVDYTDTDHGTAQEYMEDTYSVSFPRAWVVDAIREIAHEHAYHPVREWLVDLQWDGVSRMPRIVSDVLGAELLELHVEYMRCFLVGAVARQLSDNPDGVKVDTVLVLKGPQGIRKSTFFRRLAGRYFADSTMDLSSKDAYLRTKSTWIIEWSEFDHTLSRHQQAAVRGFLAAQTDTYRPPYGRDDVTVPRRSVIVGTTNEDRFLQDHAGSRRFWVIPVTRRIDTDLLSSMRDQLWAEAVHLYRSGYSWHLGEHHESERVEASEGHQIEEPWESLIRQHVSSKGITEITTDRVLLECVQKEARDWKPKDRQIIGYILKRLGFSRERYKVDGAWESKYTRPLPHDASNIVPFPVPQAPSHKESK